jgi:hypothetical protein
MKISMMKRTSLLLLVLLVACAVPQKDPFTVVREKSITLPGAVVSADGSQISYPADALFADGAVLPLPGGMEVLAPLIDLLLSSSGLVVVGTVRSDGHDPEYDRLLAVKRLDILMKIFGNRGLAGERLQMTAEVGAGAPLELQLQPFSAATSSGEKL